MGGRCRRGAFHAASPSEEETASIKGKYEAFNGIAVSIKSPSEGETANIKGKYEAFNDIAVSIESCHPSPRSCSARTRL